MENEDSYKLQASKTLVSAWVCWFLISVFYAYQIVLRVIPNVAIDQISTKFGITAVEFGQYSGLYYIAYAGMHIPMGLLFARFKAKYVMSISIITCTLGISTLAYADSWLYAMLGRLLLGGGAAAATIGGIRILRAVFGDDKFSHMLGLMVTVGMVGSIYGGYPVGHLIEVMDWQHVIQIIAAAGLILAAFTFLFVPDHREDEGLEDEGNVIEDLKQVLLNKRILLMSILGGFMIGPLEGFADAWGTKYLSVIFPDMDHEHAQALPSCIFFGMAVGCPFLPILAEKFSNAYVKTTILAGAVMALSFTLALFPREESNIIFMYAALSIVGAFCAYQILMISKAAMYCNERLASLAGATCNMIMMSFGVLFHMIIGNVLEYLWDGQLTESGLHQYDAQSFAYAMAVIPIGLLIGTVGLAIFYLSDKKNNG